MLILLVKLYPSFRNPEGKKNASIYDCEVSTLVSVMELIGVIRGLLSNQRFKLFIKSNIKDLDKTSVTTRNIGSRIVKLLEFFLKGLSHLRGEGI